MNELIKYYFIFYNVLISKLIFLFVLFTISLGLGLRILEILIKMRDRRYTSVPHLPDDQKENNENKKLTSLEVFLFASGLGFGLISLIVLIVGMYFSLNKNTFLILGIIAILISIKSLYRFLKLVFYSLKENISFNGYRIILLIIILLCLFSNIYTSLLPPTEWDELMYHLLAPKCYIEEGHIIYSPDIIYSYMPSNMEMLYTLAMLFESDISARLIHNWMTILTLLSVFAFSKRFFCRNTAFLSAFIFYTIPNIGYLSPTAYVDLGLTFYVFLSIFAFVIWYKLGTEMNSQPTNYKNYCWLILSALLLGFAMGTKHTALIVLTLMTIAIFQKTLLQKKSLVFVFISTLILIFTSLIVASLWYYRAFLYTGNPFIPFFTKIFGGGEYITPQDVATLKESLRSYDGVGRSVIHFLLLPVTTIIFRKEFQGNPGIFLLIFSLPLIFIKNISGIIKSFLFYSILFLLIWFWTSQQMRFILPVLILFSIIAGYSIVRINGWVDSSSQSEEDKNHRIRFNLDKRKDWIRLISVLFIILGTILHLMAYNSFFNLLKNIPHDYSQKVQFYNNCIESYPTIHFANTYLPDNAIIYTYRDPSKKYLYKNKVIGDIFGYGAFFKLDLNYTPLTPLKRGIVGNANIHSTLEQLRDLNVTHIVINFNRPESKVNWDFWNQHLNPLYTKNNVTLFEITY